MKQPSGAWQPSFRPDGKAAATVIPWSCMQFQKSSGNLKGHTQKSETCGWYYPTSQLNTKHRLVFQQYIVLRVSFTFILEYSFTNVSLRLAWWLMSVIPASWMPEVVKEENFQKLRTSLYSIIICRLSELQWDTYFSL